LGRGPPGPCPRAADSDSWTHRRAGGGGVFVGTAALFGKAPARFARRRLALRQARPRSRLGAGLLRRGAAALCALLLYLPGLARALAALTARHACAVCRRRRPARDPLDLGPARTDRRQRRGRVLGGVLLSRLSDAALRGEAAAGAGGAFSRGALRAGASAHARALPPSGLFPRAALRFPAQPDSHHRRRRPRTGCATSRSYFYKRAAE